MKKYAHVLLLFLLQIIEIGCTKLDGNLPDTLVNNSLQDTLIISSTSLKYIPSANKSFEMGDALADDDDTLIHMVTFTYGFYMDSTEVTQKEYRQTMSNPVYGYKEYIDPHWSETYGVGDEFPAYFVGWYDAVLYCNARSKALGKDTVYTYDSIVGIPGDSCKLINVNTNYNLCGFRLPTEAEWEYACRAGTNTDYYWGDEVNASNYACYKGNSGGKSNIVATKLPNQFDLYDMSGNLWEWCNDRYGKYSTVSVVDPTGPNTGSSRILRGGSWGSYAKYLRSSNRNYYSPSGTGHLIGFRTVLPITR